MSETSEELRLAEANATQARHALTGTLIAIQQRLNPRVLMAEAADEAREKVAELIDEGIALARARPVATGAIIAAIVAWLLRGPILRAISDMIARRRGNRTF